MSTHDAAARKNPHVAKWESGGRELFRQMLPKLVKRLDAGIADLQKQEQRLINEPADELLTGILGKDPRIGDYQEACGTLYKALVKFWPAGKYGEPDRLQRRESGLYNIMVEAWGQVQAELTLVSNPQMRLYGSPLRVMRDASDHLAAAYKLWSKDLAVGRVAGRYLTRQAEAAPECVGIDGTWHALVKGKVFCDPDLKVPKKAPRANRHPDCWTCRSLLERQKHGAGPKYEAFLEYSGPEEKVYGVWVGDLQVGIIVYNREARSFEAHLGEDPPRKVLGKIQENHEGRGLKKALLFFSRQGRMAAALSGMQAKALKALQDLKRPAGVWTSTQRRPLNTFPIRTWVALQRQGLIELETREVEHSSFDTGAYGRWNGGTTQSIEHEVFVRLP